MSQWNNSYAYNNQYQGTNAWNGDVNAQYPNQAYYQGAQYEPNQYVSFNEFLSQMQGNQAAAPAANNYNNVQYQNYAGNQYNYQNLPSTSQPVNDTYNYGPSTPASINEVETYQAQNQYVVAPDPNTLNEVVFKSNLTPTATEFVPKSSTSKSSSSSQNIKPESSKTRNGAKEPKSSQGSSTDTNWRERPSSSSQNNSSRPDYRPNDNKQDSIQKQDHNVNREPSSRNESNYRDSNNRNYDRNYESNSRNDTRFESRNAESSNRNYETRYNDRQEKGQKSNSKSKNKDSERTYYNSSINKNGQKEGSGRSGRNYIGSSRLRAVERNFSEDEQYANSYLQYRERNREPERDRNREPDRDRDRNREPERDRDRNRDYERDRDRNREPERDRNREPEKDRDRYREQERDNYRGRDRERDRDRDRDREEKIERPADVKETTSSPRNKGKYLDEDKKMTQRERLSEQLDKGTLECLVCCDRVRQTDKVWSCSNCYHVFHLRCIKKWATSSVVEGKWRCPACQNTSTEESFEYRCLCGAVKSPEWARGAGAHTCGRGCRRTRACDHPCPFTCHPGPCPPCDATVTKQCGCGAEDRKVLCSDKAPQLCGRICKRVLACGIHTCAKECHEGSCGDCPETITQVCYCELAKERTVACTAAQSARAQWSCGAQCTYVLQCGIHPCRALCHAPPCAPCPLRPAAVPTCPCGHTQIEAGARKACTDPIPLCDNICAKPLECGPAGDKHFCKLNCHKGDCPVCPEKTVLQCRCGHSSREVPCAELPQMYNNITCQKKCNKKLSCGRHRCRVVCCAEQSHRCGVVCGRTLSCQLHRCEEFCHTGHCAPCPRLSFEELTCECGAAVLYPPVRCGSKRPACSAPCPRARPCGHAPLHACHSADCPPCVVLTKKMCHGHHEERKTIPCSLEEFSCGLPCGKPLPCGKHTCIKTCHKGACDTGKCVQPCNEKRPSCGHPCAAPCHADNGGACPSAAPCRRSVRASCQCGRRHATRSCADNARDLAKLMSALAATKMQEGGSVDISEMRPATMLKTLECDDECRVEARTRQLALALQIRNPDVSAKLAPRYSDHIRNTAAKEPAFAQQVHEKLTELVQLAKKSKQKTRAHSFPSMNWQKRQFIHELCEHFGCESVAYDAEPNRNVVATADKEKSWLPAMSVLEVLAREAGKRRVPGPVLRSNNAGAAGGLGNTAKSTTGWATLTSTNAWAARSQAKAASAPASASSPAPAPAASAPKIDYFDNPPEN